MERLLYMGLLSLLMVLLAPNIVLADEDIFAKQAYIETLQTEIAKIDSEMARCKKAKIGWTTATVVGGAGVVATGTAAIVQGVKLGEKKKEKK